MTAPSKLGLRLLLAMAVLSALPTLPLWSLQSDRASELSGMTVSEIAEVSDREPVRWDDEIMLRLWYRCLRQPHSEFERTLLANETSSPETWTNDTTNVRMRVFRIAGQLRSLRDLTELQQPELGKPVMAEIELASGQRVQVGALSSPQFLPRNQPLDEAVVALGFFVRLAPVTSGSSQRTAIMLAPRLEWYPTREQSSPPVSASQLILSQAGFDLGLLDIARRFNRQPFQVEERPAFSQFLRFIDPLATQPSQSEYAPRENSPRENSPRENHPQGIPAGKTPNTEKRPALGIMDILRAPDQSIGEMVALRGNVKRVTPVDYEFDDLARTRIRYYQIDLFAPIGDGKIRMRNALGEELVFQHRFPVTVNVVHLPDKLKKEPTGPVHIEGYFYRFWNYESELSADRGGQFTPLVFATAVTPFEAQTQTLDAWLTTLLLSLLGIVVVVALYYYRSDWQHKKRRRLGR